MKRKLIHAESVDIPNLYFYSASSREDTTSSSWTEKEEWTTSICEEKEDWRGRRRLVKREEEGGMIFDLCPVKPSEDDDEDEEVDEEETMLAGLRRKVRQWIRKGRKQWWIDHLDIKRKQRFEGGREASKSCRGKEKWGTSPFTTIEESYETWKEEGGEGGRGMINFPNIW